MHLPIEHLFFNFNFTIGNCRKHLALMHIKTSFFVLYTVISGYFNEFIYEMMKWNLSKIKHHSYEVLNLQIYLIVLMLTHGNGRLFCKENVIFITGMSFFQLLPPENEFLQMFWTINTNNNEEFTIKHWQEILCRVCGGFFWSFFASVSPGTMVIWT